MNMSTIIHIADAVVAELNAAETGTFSQEFEAIRKVLPVYELPELAELKVTVVPKAVEINGSTRAASQYGLSVDIGIQKRVGKNIDEEVLLLTTLVEEIADYLRQRSLNDAPWAGWIHTENDPVYSPEHLAENRTFTSVLTLTYKAIK